MTRFIFPPSEPASDPWRTARLSPPATCDCRPADNMLLATMSARQRVSESRGAPAVPYHFGRVGSRLAENQLSPL